MLDPLQIVVNKLTTTFTKNKFTRILSICMCCAIDSKFFFDEALTTWTKYYNIKTGKQDGNR